MPKDKGKDNNSIVDFKVKNGNEYECKSGNECECKSDFVSKENFIDSLDESILSKMIFLYNAVNDGWKIEKQNGLYIFRKKHNNKEEIYSDAYLENFITDNLRFSKLV